MNVSKVALRFAVGLCVWTSAWGQSLFVADIGEVSFDSSYDGAKIYEVKQDGTRRVYADGFWRPNAIAIDAAGNLFVGDLMRRMIYKVTPEGSKTEFAPLVVNQMTADADGNVFATGYYHADPEADVWKYDPLGSGSRFASGLKYPADLVFARPGELWVRDNFFDESVPPRGAFDVRFFKFTSTGESTLVTSGLGGGIGTAFNAGGELFYNEYGGRIVKVGADGSSSTFASGFFPIGLAFDYSGNLYTAEYEGDKIYKFAPDGTRTTFASGFAFPVNVAFRPRPTLKISASAGAPVVLSWPPSTEWVLEKGSPLDGKWELVPTSSQGSVALERDAGSSFFRLRQK